MKNLIAFILVIVVIAGCKRIDRIINEAVTTRDQALFTIDEAIGQIEKGTIKLETILTNLQDRFEDFFEENLVYNVPFIINNTIGETSVTLSCQIDLMGDKAIHLLQNLKAEMFSTELPPALDPTVCNSSVNSLDLNSPSTTRLISVFGSNFNDFMEVKLINATTNNIFILPSHLILLQSSYELSINTNELEDNFLANFDFINLEYNNSSLSSWSIIKINEEPPEIKLIEITPPWFSYMPPLVRGDRELDGSADILLRAQLGHQNGQVYIQLYMKAEEPGGPKTLGVGWSEKKFFYTVPVGWRIKEITGQKYFANLAAFTDEDHEPNIKTTTIGEAKVIGDAMGDDIEVYTSVSYNFNYAVPILIEEF